MEYASLLVALVSATFYGSQFVPQKFCPKFSPELYNISMNFGIFANAFVCMILLSALGFGVDGEFAAIPASIAFVSGLVWVVGNRLLLVSIKNAGMGRSFTIINMVSVVTFVGAVLFLGELSQLSPAIIANAGLAVALVTGGSMMVTFTSSREEGKAASLGMLCAFASSIFFGGSNLLVVLAMNNMRLPFVYTLFLIGSGAFVGMIVIALTKWKGLGEWKAAPKKWHALALSSGLIWGVGDVLGVLSVKLLGGSIGVPILQGVMTLVSAIWGIGMFGEMKGEKSFFRGALAKFALGSVITIAGVGMLAQV